MKSRDLYGDGIGRVDYVSHMGTDLTVVNSARVSFGVERDELNERDKKLIRYLIEHKHTSTLEHCNITFRFCVPLFVRSQHHRHRTWSYNEISRRYTDVNIQFYEPDGFRTQHKSNRQASENNIINPELGSAAARVMPMRLRTASEAIRSHHEMSLCLFNQLLDAGVCREQARGVLPQNLYTEYYGTTNLNNLMKFINLRMHEGAQWEIQRVAEACLEIAQELYPVTVEAYKNNLKNM